MCGILGTAAPAAEASTELVAAGLVGLRHRGPEAARSVTFRTGDRACVLGHTRLRIIDLTEEADQPIANEDGTVQVVFNGELYKFPELRAELEAAGHRFASDTDTEVLVHLYEHVDGDPERLLARLRGMFAFALWDARRGRLLLARDRLGIKPMYHAALPGGGVAFASEALALARSGLIVAGPDTVSLVGYLLWGSVQGPRTDRWPAFGSSRRGRTSGGTIGAREVVPWWRPAFHPTFDAARGGICSPGCAGRRDRAAPRGRSRGGVVPLGRRGLGGDRERRGRGGDPAVADGHVPRGRGRRGRRSGSHSVASGTQARGGAGERRRHGRRPHRHRSRDGSADGRRREQLARVPRSA